MEPGQTPCAGSSVGVLYILLVGAQTKGVKGETNGGIFNSISYISFKARYYMLEADRDLEIGLVQALHAVEFWILVHTCHVMQRP